MKTLTENSGVVSKGFLNDNLSGVSWTRKVLTHRQKEAGSKGQRTSKQICWNKNSTSAKVYILTYCPCQSETSWGTKGSGWSLCCYPDSWSLSFLQHSYVKSIPQPRLSKALKHMLNPVKSRLDEKQALTASGVTKLTTEVPSEVAWLVSCERLKLFLTWKK